MQPKAPQRPQQQQRQQLSWQLPGQLVVQLLPAPPQPAFEPLGAPVLHIIIKSLLLNPKKTCCFETVESPSQGVVGVIVDRLSYLASVPLVKH